MARCGGRVPAQALADRKYMDKIQGRDSPAGWALYLVKKYTVYIATLFRRNLPAIYCRLFLSAGAGLPAPFAVIRSLRLALPRLLVLTAIFPVLVVSLT